MGNAEYMGSDLLASDCDGYTPPFPPCTPSLRTAPRSQDRDRDLQLLINKPGHHLSSLKSNFVSENERNEEASGVVHAATRSTVEGSHAVLDLEHARTSR